MKSKISLTLHKLHACCQGLNYYLCLLLQLETSVLSKYHSQEHKVVALIMPCLHQHYLLLLQDILSRFDHDFLSWCTSEYRTVYDGLCSSLMVKLNAKFLETYKLILKKIYPTISEQCGWICGPVLGCFNWLVGHGEQMLWWWQRSVNSGAGILCPRHSAPSLRGPPPTRFFLPLPCHQGHHTQSTSSQAAGGTHTCVFVLD